ncbi:Hypothetical protein Mbov_0014 [Mycoplasmopsis bovis HB0801]|nr:hypothetical protein MMB_0015 [Mycoplasmopsis bovis Hubei-1]AFM51392.1 Hypothetical protein Mbov_0014 [Mycoplasmopsis bovis HB0801]
MIKNAYLHSLIIKLKIHKIELLENLAYLIKQSKSKVINYFFEYISKVHKA